jgi:hypothetical protein
LRLTISSYFVGACRQVGRFLALEDAVNITSRAPVHVDRIGPVRDQAAGGDEVAERVDRRSIGAPWAAFRAFPTETIAHPEEGKLLSRGIPIPFISARGQQRRSKAARTLIKSTPRSRHADRQRILRLGAQKSEMVLTSKAYDRTPKADMH